MNLKSRQVFARSLALLGMTRIGITLTNFTLFALLGSYFGAEPVGRFATYISFVMLMGSAMAAGLPQLLMRRIPLLKNRSHVLVARLRGTYWIGLLFSSSLGTLLVIPIFLWLNKASGLEAPIFALAGPAAYAATMLITEELRGRAKPQLSILAEQSPMTIAPCLALLFAVLLEKSADFLINAIIISHLISTLLICISFLISEGVAINKRLAFRLIYSFPIRQLAIMAASRLSATSSGQLSILIVSFFTSSEIVAFLAISLKLVGLANTFSAVVNSYYASYYGAAHRNILSLRKLSFETALLSGIGSAIILLVIISAPNKLLEIFLSGAIIDNGDYALQVMAVAMIFRNFLGTSDLLFLVTGRSDLEISSLLASIIITTSLLLLVVPTTLSIAFSISAGILVRTISNALGMVWVLKRRGSVGNGLGS